MPFIPKIRDYNSRIALCTMHDVVEQDGMMHLTREAVQLCWAVVRPYKNLVPYITPAGFSVIIQETKTMLKVTHVITVRASLMLDYTTTAWVYEERRRTAPRWYKIVGFSEEQHWINLPCRLMEKSENAPRPRGLLDAEPSQVEL